jgi:hypothetical protein
LALYLEVGGDRKEYGCQLEQRYTGLGDQNEMEQFETTWNVFEYIDILKLPSDRATL